MKKLKCLLDNLGSEAPGENYSDYKDAIVLVANTNQTINIPTGAKYARFKSTGSSDFWIKFGGAAAVPSANVTDGTASRLNPDGIIGIDGATTVGIISAVVCTISIEYWA